MIKSVYFLRKVPIVGSLGGILLKKYNSIRFKTRKKRFLKYGNETLLKVKKALECENLLFWLDYGTLLGAYREHDFIKHDFDLDIGMWLKDADAAKQAMIKNGFKLIRFFRVKDEEEKVEYCFAYKGVSIDIFFYVQKENVALSYSFTPIIGMCRLNYPNKCGVYSIKFPYTGFRQILFKGNLYNVPLQTDKYLSAHYGSTFMEPDPTFNDEKISNATFYSLEEKEGIAVIYEYL